MEPVDKSKYSHKTVVQRGVGTPRLARGIWSPSLNDWHEVLEDYIETARKRPLNKLAMFRLQLAILGDIVTTYENITQLKRMLEDPLAAREWIPEPEPIDDFHIKYWERERDANSILLSALRDIGDGIAWRVLRFNRPLLYIMALNESPGARQFNQGLINEMFALGDIALDESIKQFFIHAITNIARLGDMTSVDENGEVEFAEVKSKPTARGRKWKERVERQIFRLDNLTKIANEGVGLADSRGVAVRMIDATPKVSLKDLRSLLAQASSTGIASRLIHPYLSVVAIDFSLIQSEEVAKRAMDESISAGDGKKDGVVALDSLSFFEFSPHRTPLSVFPFDSATTAGLLMGRTTLFFRLNLTRFFQEVERDGWKVIRSILNDSVNHNPRTDPFFVLKKGNLSVTVPPPFMGRVIFEGLSTKSIIQVCEEIRKAGSQNKNDAMIYGFSGESNLWR